MRRAVRATGVLLLVIAAASCSDARAVKTLEREQLFTLGYGVLEDQLNLFDVDGSAPPQKVRLAMRDGIFFISNGNAAKVLTMSSFGDLLAMVYNPERNPEPLILRPSGGEGQAQGRVARSYPFASPGEIAVDSKRTIFVEDRVPDGRRAYDDAMKASLEYVVLRFSRDGEYLDYLGQEGVGGTPFPLIARVDITPADECVVVCITGEGWAIFWFDPAGTLVSTITVKRGDLPVPPEEKSSIASLDGIVAAPDGSGLILKIDYYRMVMDQETKTEAGIEFGSSWAWLMDRKSVTYVERYELPGFDSLAEAAADEKPVPRAWQLVGSALGSLFLSAADVDGSTYFGVFDMRGRNLRRYALRISQDELYYSTFALSPDGILSALLGSRYEARVVLWRFDKVIGGIAP